MRRLAGLAIVCLECAAAIAGEAALPAPSVAIVSGGLRARVWLPDALSGFYRGTRFDWAGVIGGMEWEGHDFYPSWFQRCDPAVHDFVYDGTDIVAGPCTAVTGPAEEFVTDGKALGFDRAGAGGCFIKIGVGVLRRPDDRPYDAYRVYPIVDPGVRTVSQRSDAVEFRHVLRDASTGYAYEYRKTVSLDGNGRRWVLDHRLRNTGARIIRSSVYNHNFLYLDRLAPGPEVTLAFPFAVRTPGAAKDGVAQVSGNRIGFKRALAGEDRVYLVIEGYGSDARDHDIRIQNRKAGVGLRIIGDRPLTRLALWAIRAPLSIEPFIDLNVEPGTETTWRTEYVYYQLE